MKDLKLFTPVKIGPLTLRNRSIRSAAFEGMCPGNKPSQMLFDYHTSVARGGVGMTTVAYAAIEHSGLSFERQLWLKEENLPALRKLTDAIHKEGAAASIQIGHCGNMCHRSTAGCTPISASTGFNLYSPTFVRGMRKDEIEAMAESFARGVNLAREAGFDAVELHAGHGYLISQFLSPYTNHRKDEYGGSLENRMRFMKLSVDRVLEAAKGDMAVIVKMNMRDGFKGGMDIDESFVVGETLEKSGVHALVLSGGFVSKAPQYVMHGAFPSRTVAYYLPNNMWWLNIGVRLFGRMLAPTVPFKEAYFLEDALEFRKRLSMPLIYVGGLVARDKIEEVLGHGFEAVQFGRALLNDPEFINHLKEEKFERCSCTHSNFCIGHMYTLEMKCHHTCENLPNCLKREIARNEKY